MVPALQDESGRSSVAAVYNQITPESISFKPTSAGTSSAFCVSPSQLPRINQSLANLQSKYLLEYLKALDLQISVIKDPMLEIYETQVAAWTSFLESNSLADLQSVTNCLIPLTTQHISTAYQNSLKLIQESVKIKLQEEVLKLCEVSNVTVKDILNYKKLMSSETSLLSEHKDFINQTKTIKIFDCNKVTSKQLEDAKPVLNQSSGYLESKKSSIVQAFCEKRNGKLVLFKELNAKLAFRYKNTSEYTQWNSVTENSIFSSCDPQTSIDELTLYAENTNKVIVNVNTLLATLQKLEQSGSLSYTVNCKFGRKIIVKTGKPPKCPTKYTPVKVELNKI